VNGLRALIQEYPEVVRLREGGDSYGLIHFAAKNGRVDLLTVLLDLGADPNMPDGERSDDDQYEPGWTPLHYAARAGHQQAVDLLLSGGALATAVDYHGGTPLHAAQTPKIAETLLKAGADPNVICWVRYLDEALGWYFVESPLHATRNDAGLIQTLIAHGARVDNAEPIQQPTLQAPQLVPGNQQGAP
jgi:hypothetical protein